MTRPSRILLRLGAIAAVATALTSCGAAPGDPEPTPSAYLPTAAEIFPGGLYVEPDTDAAREAARLRTEGRAEEAAMIDQIASQPTAIWLGEWYDTDELRSVVEKNLTAAEQQGKTPVFVTYAVTNRDCGGYSAGGLPEDEYIAWNETLAEVLEGRRAVVLVEPDSIAMISECEEIEDTRLPLLREAVETLAPSGATLYLDAGNSHWIGEETIAERLKEAGVEHARGFFTNVSNFYRIDEEREYGEKLATMLGGAHFVIDVSRNGNGWLGHWCNPPGAALGKDPHVTGGTTGLDALLWVKHPGLSDGTCNGAPAAGEWWEPYALNLVRNREENS